MRFVRFSCFERFGPLPPGTRGRSARAPPRASQAPGTRRRNARTLGPRLATPCMSGIKSSGRACSRQKRTRPHNLRIEWNPHRTSLASQEARSNAFVFRAAPCSRVESLKRSESATSLHRSPSDGRQSRLEHRRTPSSSSSERKPLHRRCSSFIASLVTDDELVERRPGATSRLALHDDGEVEKAVRKVSRVADLRLKAEIDENV